MLTSKKFMPELHIRQPGFNYCPFGPFLRHGKRIQKFRKIGQINRICKNELDEACFAHDVACSNSKDLAKRTVSENVLKDIAYEIAINAK